MKSKGNYTITDQLKIQQQKYLSQRLKNVTAGGSDAVSLLQRGFYCQ